MNPAKNSGYNYRVPINNKQKSKTYLKTVKNWKASHQLIFDLNIFRNWQ